MLPFQFKLSLHPVNHSRESNQPLLHLRRLGHAVADGLEALEALSRIRYDVLLMDCQMPEMDGYETARSIRRQENGSRHIPIIAVTANALAGDCEKCLEAGMDDYVTKPIQSGELEAALNRCLRSRTSIARSICE